MQNKGSIRYWHRTDKPNKNGTAPVFVIYSVAGKRQYINTGVVVFPEQYDEGEITALAPSVGRKKYGLKIIDIPGRDDAKRDNTAVKKVKDTIRTIEDRFRLDGVQYTSAMVKTEYDKIRNPEKYIKPPLAFAAYTTGFINECEATKPSGTIKEYRTVEKRILEYDTQTLLCDVDYNYLEGFYQHLMTCGIGNITAAKQLSTAKTFISYAVKKGLEVNPQYKSFTVKRDTDIEVISITQAEFDTLREIDVKGNARLDAIRDVFLFSCSTGMRFSDLEQLARPQIKEDHITQTVAKTKQKLKIPLNKYSREILAKYADAPRPLPIISNQKSNDALHDLCKEAGINEPIEIVRFKGVERITEVLPKHELVTMHAGRKTFCTLSLERGMNAQEVMAISGHRDYRSFKRYVNITSQQSQKAMAKAWE
ncbi:MAG: site-specific integrase [Niabella sp.]|nr:site-specific integrase [Niabella sp.]